MSNQDALRGCAGSDWCESALPDDADPYTAAALECMPGAARIILEGRLETVKSDDSGMLSPCGGVCRMHEDSGLCLGCLRRLDEIAGWASASGERQRAIWNSIELRLQGRFA